MLGKQIVLYSVLAVFNFETEEQCEIAAKQLHGHEYVEGGCFKSYEYVLKAPLPRPDELWRSVSKGVE